MRLGLLEAAVAIVSGCTPAADPEALARCRQDGASWIHYQAPNMDGPRARAEHAMHQCQRGNYHPALEDLDAMLTKQAQLHR
jgi:hypothetical protein